jgi:hypothetical protein
MLRSAQDIRRRAGDYIDGLRRRPTPSAAPRPAGRAGYSIDGLKRRPTPRPSAAPRPAAPRPAPRPSGPSSWWSSAQQSLQDMGRRAGDATRSYVKSAPQSLKDMGRRAGDATRPYVKSAQQSLQDMGRRAGDATRPYVEGLQRRRDSWAANLDRIMPDRGQTNSASCTGVNCQATGQAGFFRGRTLQAGGESADARATINGGAFAQGSASNRCANGRCEQNANARVVAGVEANAAATLRRQGFFRISTSASGFAGAQASANLRASESMNDHEAQLNAGADAFAGARGQAGITKQIGTLATVFARGEASAGTRLFFFVSSISTLTVF